MTLPVAWNAGQGPAWTRADPVRRDLPLGTAAWVGDLSRMPRWQAGAFLLGHRDSQRIGLRDDRHVLICAGNRSGKGAGVIVPNLIWWPGSVVVIDPKGENAVVAARTRGHGSRWSRGWGQKVRLLDPFGEVSVGGDEFGDMRARFNPLDLIRADSPEAIDLAGLIADSIVVGEMSNDPFFDEAARLLLKFLILHVATGNTIASQDRNLRTVRRFVLAGDEQAQKLADLAGGDAGAGWAALLADMKNNPAFGGVLAIAAGYLARLGADSPRLFASITAVAGTNTEFIDSPGMQACLAASDFALDEVKTDPKGSSVFLCLPQRYMGMHFRWLRMMVTLFTAEMERIRQPPASGHPVMMVLDEFAALKRMKVVENAAAQIAGAGVKLVFVVQNLGQLKEVYRDNWETIVANAGAKLFFCNEDNFTRDYVSKLAGESEVIRQGGNSSRTDGTSYSRTMSHNAGISSTVSHGGSLAMRSATSTHGATQGFSSGWSQGENRGNSRSSTQGLSDAVHRRRLLNPDEVASLFGSRENPWTLCLVTGSQPMALARMSYHQDEDCAGLYGPHPYHAPPPLLEEVDALRARRNLERTRMLEAERAAARQREARDERRREALRAEQARRAAEAAAERRRQERQGLIFGVVWSGLVVALLAVSARWMWLQ